MVKMINGQFGNEMWVAEDRTAEYLAAGHKLAAEPAPAKAPVAKPKKTKKRVKAKK